MWMFLIVTVDATRGPPPTVYCCSASTTQPCFTNKTLEQTTCCMHAHSGKLDCPICPHCGEPDERTYGACVRAPQAIEFNNNRSCDGYVSQFRMNNATPTTFAQCANVTDCTALQRWSHVRPSETDQTTNVQCDQIATMCNESYEHAPLTITSDRRCMPTPAYGKQNGFKACVYDENTVCDLCGGDGCCCACLGKCNDPIKTRLWNANRSCDFANGTYMATPATNSSFGSCQPITNCTSNGTWSKVLPTWSSDVVCNVPLTKCTLGVTYQNKRPTSTSDRNCSSVTNCNTNYQYEEIAPTLVSDRVCADVSNCTGPTPYQLIPPTNTSDRNCTPYPCAGYLPNKTFANTSCWPKCKSTATSTVPCANVTNCTKDQRALAPPSLTQNWNCTINCASNEYVVAPNGDLNSKKASCALARESCPKGQTLDYIKPGVYNNICTGQLVLPTEYIVALAVGGVILCFMSACVFVTIGRWQGERSRRRVEESELQLVSARQENAESQATVQRMLSAWQIPAAHITLQRLLAEGAYGSVWKGLWGSQPVAIKVLKRRADDELDPHSAEDFRKECEALQAIKHPNLILFFGAGTTEDGKSFMVTEFLAGGSLRTALCTEPHMPMVWSLRVRIACQIAEGMRYLHSLSMVHRDLKSDNVLLDSDLNAKVADFGTSRVLSVARKVSDDVETHVSTVGGSLSATMTKGVGTQLWMAPEVFFGHSKYGPEVDVYSFGIIMWELATRKVPWYELEAPDYITQFRLLDEALKEGRRPSLPDGFEAEHGVYVATMRKCWATEPTARPSFENVVFSLSLVVSPAAQERQSNADGGASAHVYE